MQDVAWKPDAAGPVVKPGDTIEKIIAKARAAAVRAVEADLADKRYEISLPQRDLTTKQARALLEVLGPKGITPSVARVGLVGAAMVAVEAGVGRNDFLLGCEGEYRFAQIDSMKKTVKKSSKKFVKKSPKKAKR